MSLVILLEAHVPKSGDFVGISLAELTVAKISFLIDERGVSGERPRNAAVKHSMLVMFRAEGAGRDTRATIFFSRSIQ